MGETPRSRWLRRAVAGAVVLGLAALLFFRGLPLQRAPPEPVPRDSPGGPGPRPPARVVSPAGATSGAAASGAASVDPGRDLWEKRLARARETLSAYLASTRYPPASRPLSEHPDQGSPHHVATVNLPLARADRKLTNARVTLRQDRFFLTGDDRVTLGLSCSDGEAPAACEIASAMATVPPDAVGDAGARAPVPVAFTAAEPGRSTAVFQPSTQGFAGYTGTIRIAVSLAIAGESGGASFDVAYTPAAPATFTGHVREALEGGSLALYVEVTVDRPGRYVLAARADDAEGRSFAYLSYNDVLAAGRQEARLPLFGKLIRDEAARAPFRLRDVEGFLLLEDAHPDRAPMAPLEGVAYTTRSYSPRDFSDAEWESEEKDRYVKELTRDVKEAQQHAEGR
jgi:hypothetical protein